MAKVIYTEEDIVPGKMWRYILRSYRSGNNYLFKVIKRDGALEIQNQEGRKEANFSYVDLAKHFRPHKTEDEVLMLKLKPFLESARDNGIADEFKELLIELEI